MLLFHNARFFSILSVFLFACLTFLVPSKIWAGTIGCGGGCSNNNNCQTSLVCSNNKCINPNCSSTYACNCIQINALDQQSNPVTVGANNLCGVNCGPKPCAPAIPSCNGANGSSIIGPDNGTNRGGIEKNTSFIVLAVTPMLVSKTGPAVDNSGTYDPTCKGINSGGYCYYWPSRTSGNTDYRQLYFILATPTPLPTNAPTLTPLPPIPTLYPTSVINGSLQTQLSSAGSCSPYTSGPTPAIGLNPDTAYDAWVTTDCSTNVPAGTYQCTVAYDNQSNSSLPTTINETLSSNVSGQPGNWHVANACGGSADNTRALSSGSVYSSGYDIFFSIQPWVKVVNGSFNTSGLSFLTIPDAPVKFLADPASDPDNPYFLDQSNSTEAGLATNAPNNWAIPTSQLSQSNWQTSSYIPTLPFLGSGNFTNYIKARKQFTALSSSPSDLSGLTDGIYYYNGAVTLTKAPVNNVVLVVDGNVTISSNLAPTKGFALIVNGSMTLDNAVTKLTGLYVASSFATGTASGLEVIGNLVSAAAISNNLVPTNNLAPSMLVVFDPTQYVDLLPYLSVSKYNWQLLQ